MNFKKFSLVVENNHRIKIQGEHARNRRIFFVRQIRRCINFFSLLLSLSSSLNSTNIKQEANNASTRKKERKRGEQKLHPNRSFQLEIPLIILPPFYHTTLSSSLSSVTLVSADARKAARRGWLEKNIKGNGRIRAFIFRWRLEMEGRGMEECVSARGWFDSPRGTSRIHPQLGRRYGRAE